MNEDLEKICMDVITEASTRQMGRKLSVEIKRLMKTQWDEMTRGVLRQDQDVLGSTIIIAIKFGLETITRNFAEAERSGYALTGPEDKRFNELVDANNAPKLEDIVKTYLTSILEAISSIDENALIDKYLDDGSNKQQNTEPNKTSVQQDAEMLARMRAAQAEPDESKRMETLANIDAEIDRQKGKI